jgi:hypothetical protein
LGFLGGAALAAPYAADPYYYYDQPYYGPAYPSPGYGVYDPNYLYPDPYDYRAGDPSDPRY